MESYEPVRWLAESSTPLISKFGDRLTLVRDRDRVQWSFEGNAAIVELQPGGELRATFVAAPAIDEVSARPVSAVYRSHPHRYQLTREGSARMIDDMVAFFSGTREPRFSFFGLGQLG
jgi:hypothetical protein